MAVEFDASERRLFARFKARYPAKIKDARDEYGESINLNDASAQGANITCKERFFINDSVSVDVKLPDGNNPLSIKGQVVWAKQDTSQSWEVGLKFHEIALMNMSRLYRLVTPSPPPQE